MTLRARMLQFGGYLWTNGKTAEKMKTATSLSPVESCQGCHGDVTTFTIPTSGPRMSKTNSLVIEFTVYQRWSKDNDKFLVDVGWVTDIEPWIPASPTENLSNETSLGPVGAWNLKIPRSWLWTSKDKNFKVKLTFLLTFSLNTTVGWVEPRMDLRHRVLVWTQA
jgi:hypothetical protein